MESSLDRLAAAAFIAHNKYRGIIPDRGYENLHELDKQVWKEIAFAVILQCAAECDVEVEKVQ